MTSRDDRDYPAGGNLNARNNYVRADARRERIADDAAARRLVKEARREEAMRDGKPLRRVSLSRVLDAMRHRDR